MVNVKNLDDNNKVLSIPQQLWDTAIPSTFLHSVPPRERISDRELLAMELLAWPVGFFQEAGMVSGTNRQLRGDPRLSAELVNKKGYRGKTPLMQAISSEDITRVQFLLNLPKQVSGLKIDLEITSIDGYTALMYAILEQNLILVDLLVKAGANLETQATWGNRDTALLTACRPVDTALMTAKVPQSYDKISEIVKYLINAGADVSARDQRGNTALFLLCEENKFNTMSNVQLLVERGANVDAVRNDGFTVLMVAIRVLSRRFLLLPHNDPQIAEFLASKITNLNAASFNAFPGRGYTALLMATESRCTRVVQILLGRGANVNFATNIFGETALMVSCGFYDSSEIMLLLLNEGANVNMRQRDGRTALLVLSSKGLASFYSVGDRVSQARILIQRGADVNAADTQGTTSLMLACVHNSSPLARLLVENGAHIDQRDLDDNNTALMIATIYRRKDIARLLVQKGADKTIRNSEGQTAYDIFINDQNDDDEMGEILRP